MNDLSNQVVLEQRITLAEYRAWVISQTGLPESALRSLLERLPPPEVELSDLIGDMLPTDELWLCRSRVFDPQALMGSRGIAVVRDGRPVRYKAIIHY